MGVSVRHNSKLAAVVALVAAVLTVAWFARALQTGALADWFWCVVVAVVGVLQLLVVRDSRAPLMVADEHGVRVRRGVTWSGLRWQDIADVEVTSPSSWLRDGRILVRPRTEETGPDRDEPERRVQHVVPPEGFVVPLAVTTRVDVDGLTGDLVADLDSLASGRVPVLVLTRVEPESATRAADADTTGETGEASTTSRPSRAERAAQRAAQRATARAERARAALADPAPEAAAAPQEPEEEPEEEQEPEEEPQAPRAQSTAREHAAEGATEQQPVPREAEPDFDPVEPARESRPAARSEVVRDSVRMLPTSPPIPAQRSGAGPVVVATLDDVGAGGSGSRDDLGATGGSRSAENAVIGPLVAAARHRARLSIDTLSERTRIRPHVLECIEVDDFAVCGGDFYARGHLRTLARVFGLDAQELLDLYDDHYASAEIEARQVFEAELATGIGGGVRATHSGPRWSLLAACVLALASVWGVARVFNDTPQELVSPAPGVVDSAGLAGNDQPADTPKSTLAALEVAAVGESPQVVVRDKAGRILWAGKLASGQHQQVIGSAPFDVTASNGGAVKVRFLGKPRGTVGDSSDAASKHFG